MLLDLSIAGYTTMRVFETRHIPRDAGRTTWLAVRLLWQGENPFGLGALVDTTAFEERAPARLGTPLASSLNPAAFASALKRYEATPDPELRRQLLPVSKSLPRDLAVEARLSGYKYGPVILMVTAPFALINHPAVIMLLNAAATAGLFLALGLLAWQVAGENKMLAALGIASLLLERSITAAYVSHSSTDIWALLPMAFAVLCHLQKRHVPMAILLAVAVAAKIFPALILVPLLLCDRPRVRVPVFLATLALLLGPWFALDPLGFVANVFLWPMLMYPQANSWIYFLSFPVATAARIVLFAGIGFVWWRYCSGREPRLFWTAALASTLLLLAGNHFQNNYLPWATIWMQLAIVEAFRGRVTSAVLPARPREIERRSVDTRLIEGSATEPI
ncbi:MAG TPA: glycosyltransferase 87 family protein [Stellaceae bacterium]